MRGNTIGKSFTLTTWGESHGLAVGGVIDGCPAGLCIDFEFITHELNRRKTGFTPGTTERIEDDKIEILSGISNNITTGTPIFFKIENQNTKPDDYKNLSEVYRPSHADFTWEQKFGEFNLSGGGRASARETVARVAGGAIAKLLLQAYGVTFRSWVSAIGPFVLKPIETIPELSLINSSSVKCPDKTLSAEIETYIQQLKTDGDTCGGIITCCILNAPIGLGEPVFDKLEADLAKAMLSIPSVKGFETGSGFEGAKAKGSEHNDIFLSNFTTHTNHSGGIQGGISNGMPINFNVAFKPVSSIKMPQKTANKHGKITELKIEGRHDVCVVPRALPIVEAMAALVLADHVLRNKTSRI